jgi:2-dehydro-3-deoxyphosphogluconate aldolase / (4S)-4-hydroxy-2-oxoglutarate aldolase
MDRTLEQVGRVGILPVAIINDETKAVQLARVLCESGLPAIEVTFRTKAAASVIERIAADSLNIIVGAGTILTTDQAQAAIDAGARFIVSPGLSTKVIEYCLKKAFPVIPGIATPTEIQQALEYGLDVVKFFPAEACGGLQYLKAISAPFKELKFIPTGGIEQSTLLPYLRHPNVLACGGSWMVHPDLINAGKFDEIGTLSRQAVSLMLGFDIRHIGMNSASADEARSVAEQLGKLFHLDLHETNGSFFVGTGFEVLKRQYLGTHGHIAIATNFIDRAIAHLERIGIQLKPETKNEKNGSLSTVYIDCEVGGFAIHLFQL